MTGSSGGVLTITHTLQEGTLLRGTEPHDGTADILKSQRWRWSPNIGDTGCWFLPRSRGALPKTRQIESTAAALEAAGFTVTAAIDPTSTSSDVDADRPACPPPRERPTGRHLAE